MANSAPAPKPLHTIPTRRNKAKAILAALRAEFPRTKCSLDHRTPWELLVSTILSAQCTDARVNQVTPILYANFPTMEDYITAPIEEIQEAIHSTGFYRNKSKSLQGAARALLENHNGEVPDDIKLLLKIPGVGRKTANVVLGEIFNKPAGVVVDTHVSRISLKLGLTDSPNPIKAERQLNEIMPQSEWKDYGHLIIDHGRKTCRARVPKCDNCNLYRWCLKRA